MGRHGLTSPGYLGRGQDGEVAVQTYNCIKYKIERVLNYKKPVSAAYY
jgi:hypothetical protein